MKKLTLDLDAIAVDSFATGRDEGELGTVQAREAAGTQLCAQTYPYCKTVLTYCPCTPRWEEPRIA